MLPPFQVFLDDHRDAVWRFCVAVAGPAEAEDCFQETFLAALGAYPRLRRNDNLRAWVLRIAYTKAMDAHRDRARRPRPVPAVPDRPADAVREHDDELWALVRTLPDRQRAAVAYRFVLDMSYTEVAQAMSCTEEAARRNVHEAIKKMRGSGGVAAQRATITRPERRLEG